MRSATRRDVNKTFSVLYQTNNKITKLFSFFAFFAKHITIPFLLHNHVFIINKMGLRTWNIR